MQRKSIIRKLKHVLIVILILVLAFAGYVEIVNRNSTNMTYRQKVLKAVYPLFMWWSKKKAGGSTQLSHAQVTPPVSFYSLSAIANNGTPFSFGQLQGKKVLLVNTASDCGYTNQYEDLQRLSEQYKDKLVVIGFPANDFKEQEKGTDEEIAQFCKVNFGVSFPLMKKSVVIKSDEQNPVFKWLTDSSRNGWNNKPPSWNFSKYLVSENGVLLNYFGPSVEPMGKDLVEAITKK